MAWGVVLLLFALILIGMPIGFALIVSATIAMFILVMFITLFVVSFLPFTAFVGYSSL